MNAYRNFVRSLAAACLLGWAAGAHGGSLFSFGDAEKPKPDFQRSGQEVSARFIPRAKSTSVTVTFRVAAGGVLEDVRGIDFDAVQAPEVDVKNFKSAVFEIRITGVEPGEKATAALQSDFFSQSTAFYVYNPNREKKWSNPGVDNRSLAGRVRELSIAVQDGGDLDADGAKDGRVTLIGGPRDSFWGYALGTLFIRFFGIFIVLSVLMIGMILSGIAFKAVDRLKVKRAAEKKSALPEKDFESGALPDQESEDLVAAVPAETAAAIAAAIHLHFAAARGTLRPQGQPGPENAWAEEGRRRMMHDRMTVFNRFNS